MGPISASFGEDELFCAIDASGKQDVICWGKNTTSPPLLSSSSPYDINNIPAMSALSGGEGFLCGILANTSQAFCWGATMTTRSSVDLGLVPPAYRNIAYSNIVAGKDHVCSVRGSYYADHDSGTEDCWEISRNVNNTLVAKLNGSFSINLEVNRVVSGEGFTCGEVSSSALVCWGPDTESLGVSNVLESFAVLAVGRNTVCGISNFSSDFRCWGDPDSFSDPPSAEVVVDDEEPVINLPLNLKNNFHHVLK
ncbi:Regulator of chromosome condensation 1/beta-lactamase-inhibitor protein II [Sesbania bispinosa]|nr:Regulator of chromosome condensation 1/beta-lactamase-inhibitor protein II [Sesbania bispinosa]